MKPDSARASIYSITLINFNGIQFEHLAFDHATTSLEGRNGAGKTTTMVGSYLPLMPDQNFLRFKNISDNNSQAKSDTGLYDRLGEYGDVAYSIMSITLSDGTLVHIGVEVQKRPQRKYELMPFLVRDVPHGLSPENLWMVRDSEGRHCIAPLARLSTHIVSLGAYLRKFVKLPDYFHMLFESGIAPALMTTAHDRSKFHKLMMASFYGGLTSDLQKSIKDYLLPENRDVATAVARARDLLREVKITRHNILLAQEAYSKVQAIDRLAFELMASEYYNLSNQFDGSRKEMAKCRETFHQQKVAHHACRLRVAQLNEDKVRLAQAVERAKAALKIAEQRQDAVARAHACAGRIEIKRPLVLGMKEAHALAEQACQAATLQQQEVDVCYRGLLEEQKTLALSMGNARLAFEEISRKVGLYNAAQRALAEAREALGESALAPAGAAAARVVQQQTLKTARAALEPVQRALQHAEDAAAAFNPVRAALETLAARQIAPEQAFSDGQAVLAQYRLMADQVWACIGIEDKIRSAAANARRQGNVREALALLGADGLHIDSSAGLAAAILDVMLQADIQWERQEREQARAQRITEELHEVNDQSNQLRISLKQWTQADELRVQLEALSGFRATDADALQEEQGRVSAERQTAQGQLEYFTVLMDEARSRMIAIQDNGSRLDERLSILADKVGGRLVSEFYDDVALEQAARAEASMGPLLEAISVPDIRRAAATLAADPRPPNDVWLIADDDIGTVQRGEFLQDLCLVTMGTATYLSAIPTRPVLGRAAREAEIAQLNADIDSADVQRKTAAAKLQGLVRQLAAIEALQLLQEWLIQPSPLAALQSAADSIVQCERQIADAVRGLASAKEKGFALRTLLGRLQACSADGAFIEGDDWNQMWQELVQQHRLAGTYQRKIAAVGAELNLVQQGLDVLRTPPLTAVAMAAQQQAGADLEASIRQANLALDRLANLMRQMSYFGFADQVLLEQQRNGVLAKIAEQEGAVARALKTGYLDSIASADAHRLAEEARNTAHGKWMADSAALKALEGELDAMDCPCDAQALALAGETARQAEMDEHASAAAHLAAVERLGGEARQLDILYGQLIGHPAGSLSQARNATRQLIRIRKDWTEFAAALKQADAALCQRLAQPAAVEEYQPQSYVTLGASLGKLRRDLHAALGASNAAGVLLPERASRNGNDYLNDWMAVRRYLEQSLPRTITQSDNIEQALNDITEALCQMQEKQREQEGRFRTNAESVANSISNLVRREIANINRINTDKKLEAVRFGSISGIRIQASRVERMAMFLDALRREPDLFDADRPLEEALAMLYARSNNGSIDGAQLLDYRNYIQVQIQVRRLAQSEWDNNIGASSGEGIGVGAAILVVILDAMERQAETLQRRKVKGSVRFLMLDEANRLDMDALEMMASFCQATGVQLLVAAPEIARARSGTTFCFVRRATSRGQEVEVTYRGRRGFQVGTVA